MIRSLCRTVKRTKKKSEQEALRFAFDELQSSVHRRQLDSSVRAVFDEHGIRYGEWSKLMNRMV